ncbi:SH3 domain-containing protein [Seohaeicola sp. SP36]|uniref:SH3 domain-containing protein n=1 Tax=unclassified Seohaeicola TaxID=2641111 RepID=UPI003D80A81A
MKKLSFRADRGSVRAKRAVAALLAVLVMSPLAPQAQAADRGSVTNLPLPRYVSIKSGEVNVRRGPSLTHRVDWVFTREDMPVEITAEHGHWRRVRDRDGAGGWVHYSLLSGTRTVIVDQDMLALHSRPDPAAPANAHLEQGVVARLDNCTPDWCRLSAGGYRGWAPKTALWGVKPDEVRE